jgi:hypothetical protein
MNDLPAKIQRIIRDGYTFRFGDYISQGFDIMNRNAGAFVGFILVFALISIGLAFLPFVGSIASILISPPLSVGFYIVAHKVVRGEQSEFNDFFKGFEKWGDLVLSSILRGLIGLGAALPGLILFGIGIFQGFSSRADDYESSDLLLNEPAWNLNSMAWGGLLLAILPAIYFGVSYIFAPLYVWFYGLKPWPAMEASRKTVGLQWWAIFGFLIVTSLIGGLGALLLLVGALYTAPAMTCAIYAAFADITDLNQEDEGEKDFDPIDHFVPGA